MNALPFVTKTNPDKNQNKRTFLILASLILLGFDSVAQTSTAFRDTGFRVRQDTLTVVEKKLVELAMNGPEVRRVEHENKVYQYQLQSAKTSWMNFLTFSINYNDQNLKSTPGVPVVYPKYFIGLNIPVGTFISSKQTKIARESLAIGTYTEEETKRRIKSEVLSKYRQYRSYSELISLQSELLNDIQAALTQTEDKFRKGNVTFDVYNAAQKNKNDEVSKLISLQLEQDMIRLDLERIIGTTLDTVFK